MKTAKYQRELDEAVKGLGVGVCYDIANYDQSHFDVDNRQLHIMRPTDLVNLFVALHEVGHVVHKDGGNADVLGIFTIFHNPFHAECLASCWAKQYMEKLGLVVPPAVWAEAQRNWKLNELMQREEGRA